MEHENTLKKMYEFYSTKMNKHLEVLKQLNLTEEDYKLIYEYQKGWGLRAAPHLNCSCPIGWVCNVNIKKDRMWFLRKNQLFHKLTKFSYKENLLLLNEFDVSSGRQEKEYQIKGLKSPSVALKELIDKDKKSFS